MFDKNETKDRRRYIWSQDFGRSDGKFWNVGLGCVCTCEKYSDFYKAKDWEDL